ncbi:conserved hypothetical protein [Gloeothece citriformis PCC 7424]|uniref:Uncharacterized protein n=1 Tax=Gloeothece citriformis (strain PCC 7424) TaxID=65393 RepID=B7KJL2_GLOC7|nr:hypothetical protein [Gloeothece citriformis]ACK73689.1 conserved hypothetical protein [Gloeothece citriformis PCC 7424]
MTFFNLSVPILRRKEWTFKNQTHEKLLEIKVKIKQKTLFSSVYTCIDQAFILWGLISAAIFFTAQFFPISWITQAIIWSGVSLIATLGMIILTYNWAKKENLRWLLYCWAVLMTAGVIVTDSGIFLGWSWVLMNLSHLWLGLSVIGYILTGWGMRSRAFFIAAVLHFLGMAILPLVMGWQFLTTGLIMMLNLLVFAQTQWDDYGCH